MWHAGSLFERLWLLEKTLILLVIADFFLLLAKDVYRLGVSRVFGGIEIGWEIICHIIGVVEIRSLNAMRRMLGIEAGVCLVVFRGIHWIRSCG